MTDIATTPAIVRLDDVVKTYGTARALDGMRFSFGLGETVALLGPNGAGKTTLIGCLLGFLLPSSGSVRVFDTEAAGLDAAQRGRIGFVPQAMTGFSGFSAGELLDYLAHFQVPKLGRFGTAPFDARLADWARLPMGTRVKSLSGGQRQRLSIILALRHAPDLLVLDEPVASLDPQARHDFMALLAEYRDRTGAAVLISSHILSDLERIATRAVFVAHGRVVHDTPMARFRDGTRLLRCPPEQVSALRSALVGSGVSVLRETPSGALLVDGWQPGSDSALRATGLVVEIDTPDLEATFLEMTR
ncbi:ABC-2 type transport system ATP-binding protein [Endobacter medicaginis]|uniref:ABC transporter ATP-binding protein n=1 Tax=Endobacter medicaginis TaxID=1181271 RepID=A0A850NNM5_9PROT|nr:ABC transporter ATP-binding protein [Endobacter medicaginis]MBB3173773.1 ABC-2 type transport system ATP-binding protein [Endobacter medicaginis]MCX5475590.1 ABC transporter ATP-binding protein [Endobacter medicaginis]NVN31173.1 ABC transporter ATP-binding protein [Endobacter medicaginis]